ncbi:succinate dehydrogenase, hydrophobic membrane anchor protein [Methylomarinum sp. Ch1-1]|uniref:Succinate dehydrogenase hydrophobic membrane anchor subunit n=1 Tax=Methylomarinum roseum TaxID=3067653 RepID=A0AAU7NQN3_9GAMM|nr:succinate dehydrogenase, hydrophobic membrane anchor protein [Methylomarinum sp. Ch1-1]MDP4520798.1 succinate dehydrogenase, hydrophobic membrane anchor protein [Methylomarinum sp. Ch1-1]
MEYKTPLASAQGLGSAKTGTGHWWLQRVTAVALIPLSVWMLKLLKMISVAPYAETIAWLTEPLNTACIAAWTIAVFYHAALGVQVVIEDYVSTEWLKIVAVWVNKLVCLFLAGMALLAIFRTISAG